MSVVSILNKLLGDPNEKEVKRLWPLVHQVRALSNTDAFKQLQLADLPVYTQKYRDRIAAGETLEQLLPEAFSLVIRACELLNGQKLQVGKQEFGWNMIPFDVQILGGIVLHRGCISEMKTGEGKTLVCTLPVYLNALAGKGVHVVTVNDYLAKRDATWMGMLYQALGLSVGVIVHGLSSEQRRQAYAADVTYGTNNEFGFDYLRDNMATSIAHQVQRGLHYAIVDEVDSILVDEARTPLIISQPAEESTTKYQQYAQLVLGLQENVHFTKDEKQRVATLSEEGIRKMEELLHVENIYTDKGFEEVHHIEQALRAHAIYRRDVDYVVKDGEIIIVDEFTGRLMPGRRYSHGLHQALEAKEGVQVQRESRTLATITFQNYFRLFTKLAGMTGTAKTEEEEFESIYKLRTIVVPTHRPVTRIDRSDAIYRTVEAKFRAVAKIAAERHAKGQPLLLGTTSIEKSEVLSLLLTQEKVPHQVLNAKQHEKEAEIVAQAGQKGAVTIATNMAGRGTDIKLGEGVTELGGLCVLGTERHEARRIDNQLRGRSGRQGDPGESQFFVSMEDELMRLFGGDRLKTMMERLKVPDDVPLENGIVSRSIESAQKKVEGRNFDIRRHVVQYDDVMNKHREIIYTRRQRILEKIAEAENGETRDQGPGTSDQESVTSNELAPLHEDILAALHKEIEGIVALHAPDVDPENWNVAAIRENAGSLHQDIAATVTDAWIVARGDSERLREELTTLALDVYTKKCAAADPIAIAQAERVITLRSIDMHWMDHIDAMAQLREQVAFSGYAQRDPLIEYKDQGFRSFRTLLGQIETSIIRTLLQIDFVQFQPREVLRQAEEELAKLRTNEDEIEAELTETGVEKGQGLRSRGQVKFDPIAADHPSERLPGVQHLYAKPPISQGQRAGGQVGRNDPCPCGSGKKYKKCHGQA